MFKRKFWIYLAIAWLLSLCLVDNLNATKMNKASTAKRKSRKDHLDKGFSSKEHLDEGVSMHLFEPQSKPENPQHENSQLTTKILPFVPQAKKPSSKDDLYKGIGMHLFETQSTKENPQKAQPRLTTQILQFVAQDAGGTGGTGSTGSTGSTGGTGGAAGGSAEGVGGSAGGGAEGSAGGSAGGGAEGEAGGVAAGGTGGGAAGVTSGSATGQTDGAASVVATGNTSVGTGSRTISGVGVKKHAESSGSTRSIRRFHKDHWGNWVYHHWGVTKGQVLRNNAVPRTVERLGVESSPSKDYYPHGRLMTVCIRRPTIYNRPVVRNYLKRRVYMGTHRHRPVWKNLRLQIYKRANSEECHNKTKYKKWRDYQECAIKRNQRMEYFIPKYPLHQAGYRAHYVFTQRG